MMLKRNSTDFKPFKMVIDIDSIEELIFFWAITNAHETDIFKKVSKITGLKQVIEKEIRDAVKIGVSTQELFNKLDNEFNKYFDSANEDDDIDDVIDSDDDADQDLDLSDDDEFVIDDEDDTDVDEDDSDDEDTDNTPVSELPLCNSQYWDGNCEGCTHHIN